MEVRMASCVLASLAVSAAGEAAARHAESAGSSIVAEANSKVAA
jgi:hypothetical protein